MTGARNTPYSRRHNYDGSFNSICKICFATIAHAKDETALAEQEKNRSCDYSLLFSRGILNPMAPTRRHHSGLL